VYIGSQMKTRELTEKLEDWQKRATETCRDLSDATDKYVHDNTWTSIACAAAVGVVIGYLIASSRD
jgi:ElaB/YqjD/DUF883 family membrane-anchored ribosome-binding protein